MMTTRRVNRSHGDRSLRGWLGVVVAVLVAIIGPSVARGAEPETKCPEPEARQFDFWIGDWDIQQKILGSDGGWIELPAHTHVEPILGGCALLERWSGRVQFFWEGMSKPEAMDGMSVRAWDPKEAVWRIWWMDSRSRRLGVPAVGEFRDGRGEFESSRKGADGKTIRTRISFERLSTGRVHWDLAISRDAGRNWQTIWIMEMRRSGSVVERDVLPSFCGTMVHGRIHPR